MIRPIVPVKIVNSVSGEFRIVNGMVDSGADRDVINGKTIKELGITTTATELRVVTVDNSTLQIRPFIPVKYWNVALAIVC